MGTTKIGFWKATTSQKKSSDTEHLKRMKTVLPFPLSLAQAFDLTQEMWYLSEVEKVYAGKWKRRRWVE